MKLSECEILPGIILDVEDPKHIGRVKAMVPTWFDADVMNKEAMPWIWPCGMGGYQRFSKLENGRKIWVLHNKENDLEYWYWPMFEETEQTKPIIDQYDSTEILLARGGGESSGGDGTSGDIFIYYNDSDGIVLKIGDTKINITNTKEIHITDSKSTIKIVGGIITIGKEGDEGERAILGETLKEVLTTLSNDIKQAAQPLKGDPYIADHGEGFVTAASNLNNGLENILSDTVKISK